MSIVIKSCHNQRNNHKANKSKYILLVQDGIYHHKQNFEVELGLHVETSIHA